MSIRTPEEFDKLRRIGRIVRDTLDSVAAAVRPGITTAELDEIGARILADRGAQSAPPKVYAFPGALCISVNDEAIHGVPGSRRIEEGDIVKLDLVAEKDEFYADAAVTVAAGEPGVIGKALIRCVRDAFRDGARAARAGNTVYDVSRAIERKTRRFGFEPVRGLSGHGVGRTIHEAPSVPNYRDSRCRAPLTEGLVITIEPIVCSGIGHAYVAADGWTIRTSDGSLSAHFEHTIVITKTEPILLTAAA